MADPVVVSGRPSNTGLTWWVLAGGTREPTIRLEKRTGEPLLADVTVHHLHDLGNNRNVYLVAATELGQDRACVLKATDSNSKSARAFARTLPGALVPDAPFTIGFGSCYNWPMDVREIYRWFPPKAHHPESADPLRLCFLLGDQIYMDLEKSIDPHDPNAWSEPLLTDAPDPWKEYFTQWSDVKYRFFLTRSGTSFLFLADDHEMWNDYPYRPPWLQWIKGDEGRRVEREIRNAFDVFQGAPNLEPDLVAAASSIPHTLIRAEGLSFSFDVPPLSFFVLDTRFGRTRAEPVATAHFTNPEHLNALVTWLENLTGFGILAIAPPVFHGPGSLTDHNLPDYERDYQKLIAALAASPKPVLILSGDIHQTRLRSFSLTPHDPTPNAVEFVSSALSRIRNPEDRTPLPPDVVSGTLGASGAFFELEPTDDQNGDYFATTERQTYGTVTFTLRDGGSALETVMRCWVPGRTQTEGALLLLERTLVWDIS